MFATLKKVACQIIQISYIDCENKELRTFTININKKQARDIYNIY